MPIDWTSFTAGLVSTLVGAALAFALVSWTIHLRHKRRRHTAIGLIEAELGALLQGLLNDQGDASMSAGTRLQLFRVVYCLQSLRGFERGNGRYISTWALLMLQALLLTSTIESRPRMARELVLALELWQSDERNWRWFRDEVHEDATSTGPSRVIVA